MSSVGFFASLPPFLRSEWTASMFSWPSWLLQLLQLPWTILEIVMDKLLITIFGLLTLGFWSGILITIVAVLVKRRKK